MDVLNEVNPEYVRFRRLWPIPKTVLYKAVQEGEFTPQTPEGTVHELREIMAGLEGGEKIRCDHVNNYVRVSGNLRHDKDKMLKEIGNFLALPEWKKEVVYRTTPDCR